MQIVFLVIFGTLWSAGVLFMDGMMTQQSFRQLQSRQFPTAEGVMTQSEVQTYHGRHKGRYVHEAVFSYQFQVAGRKFFGERWRHGDNNSTTSADARAFAAKHPKGSAVQVYYNPDDPTDSLLSPGLRGVDFIFLLFGAPFNAIMFGFWLGIGRWLRERIFRPQAGGLKVIKDALTTRVQMPNASPIALALVTTGGLGIVFTFIVGFSTRMNPSIGVILASIALVYLAGAGIFVWQWLKIQSGTYNLIINHGSRTVDLPPTCGRKQRMTIDIANIDSVWAEKRTHYSSKGSTSYTYAVSFSLRHTDPLEQKLADWSDQVRAEDFKTWLSKELSLQPTARTA